MATTLYDLSVPTFLQTVRAVGGFLDRAARHCAEIGADPDDFVQVRLFEDICDVWLSPKRTWGPLPFMSTRPDFAGKDAAR